VASGWFARIVQIMSWKEDAPGTGGLKTCTACKALLPVHAFNRDATKPDGRYPRCKVCRSGPTAILKVSVYGICLHCKRRFKPRHNAGQYVQHCSRQCATKAGVWRGPSNATWLGDDIGYSASHARIYSHRGKPDLCVACGTSRGRFHWALNHDRCPMPLEAPEGPYSPDPDDYIAMCVPCHKAMDLRRHDG
jgi:hypothetical protein